MHSYGGDADERTNNKQADRDRAAALALICHTSETDETHDGYDG